MLNELDNILMINILQYVNLLPDIPELRWLTIDLKLLINLDGERLLGLALPPRQMHGPIGPPAQLVEQLIPAQIVLSTLQFLLIEYPRLLRRLHGRRRLTRCTFEVQPY